MIILVGVLTFIDVTSSQINKTFLIVLIVIFTMLSFLDKIKDEREKNEDSGKMKNLCDTQELILKDNIDKKELLELQQKTIGQLNEEVKQHRLSFDDWKTKKETSIQLINELIQNGVITESDAFKNFDNQYLYVIYCYAKSLPKIWGKFKRRKRMYPDFFQNDLKCFRVGQAGQIYITNSKRLPVRLHNSYNLKNFILAKLENYLKLEWEDFVSELQKSKHKDYKKFKGENYKKYLRVSIAIFKCSINDKNIGKIRALVFPPEFNELLNEEVDLRKVELPKEKKAEVKKFICSCSIEFLFRHLEEDKLNILLLIENELKTSLKINSIFDYLERKPENIRSFFIKKGFNGQADFYTDSMLNKLKGYRDSLKELNIVI